MAGSMDANGQGIALGASELPVSTLAVVILFSVNFLVLAVQWWKGGAAGGEAFHGKKIPALTFTRPALFALTSELGVLGAILAYTWISENAPIFPHEQKDHVPDFFWFICLMVLMFAFGSIEHDPKSTDLINRDQTEEWKGWMQTVFLLYHYMHSSEVYNAVRVMISCYVWMTGFGNLSFFYIKRDYGFVRFAQMMWRLNFTVLFLCLVMNNMYMLYYICPLHTFYFLVVFATMRVARHVNHTKWPMRIKLATVGVIIFAVWEFGAIFDVVFAFMPNEPHPGAAVGAYGIKYEWHFRSGLDHYSTFFGMIFALNFPQAMLWIAKVEALPWPQQTAVKSTVGAALLIAAWWWATEIFPLPKLQFNQVNPYTFMIPLLTYIYFRNITPWLRQVHLGVLATIGKYTLETYLMQHHVWLTSNAKTVLVLVPGYPKINLVVVTAIYFTVARRLYRVTMFTRAMLVPEDPFRAMNFLAVQGLILGSAGLLAWFLQIMGAGWSLVIVAIVLVGAAAIAVLERAIASNEPQMCNEAPASTVTSTSRWALSYTACAVGLASAAVGLLLLPAWVPVGAPINGGPLRPHLAVFSKRTCLDNLSDGAWVDVSSRACSRHDGPACIADSWVWRNHLAEKACKYKQIPTELAANLVAKRHFAFVGDENVYELATATHTVMAPEAGHLIVGEFQADFVEEISVAMPGATGLPPGTVSYSYVPSVTALQKQLQPGSKLLEADVLVLGAWLHDAATMTPAEFTAAWDALAAPLGETSCLLLLPGSVVDGKVTDSYAFGNGKVNNATASAMRAALLQSKIAKKCAFVIDLAALTSARKDHAIDGVRYDSSTYNLPAQLLLNAINIDKPPAVHPPRKSATAAKGAGGGIAQNPAYGLAVLLCAFAMLYTMDNYAGISFLVLRVFPPFVPPVTWEDATRVLHSKLGVPFAPVVDEQEEGELMIQREQSDSVESRTGGVASKHDV